MDVEVIKKDGSKFLLSQFGTVQDFIVGSIPNVVNKVTIEGRPGSADYGAELGDRTITVPLILKGEDLHDFAHFRDELFNIIGDSEPFYIREKRRLKELQYEFVDFGKAPKWSPQTDNKYVNGKQYLVRVDGEFEFEQEGLRGYATVKFVTSGLPYAESVYTTKELNDTGLSALAEKYGLVDGIDDEQTQYVFTDNTFSVWNAGNVTVEPESMYIYITLGLVTTDGSLKLTNKTTGETFEFRKAVTNRNIYLDGMNIMEGTAINALRNTNRQRIKLVPGVNNFEITGATFSKITVSFKFYYK